MRKYEDLITKVQRKRREDLKLVRPLVLLAPLTIPRVDSST